MQRQPITSEQRIHVKQSLDRVLREQLGLKIEEQKARVQCEGMSWLGARCMRKAAAWSRYCVFHEEQVGD